jgi:hypothetical protein
MMYIYVQDDADSLYKIQDGTDTVGARYDRPSGHQLAGLHIRMNVGTSAEDAKRLLEKALKHLDAIFESTLPF